jgi:hypothetical protein
MHPIAALPQYPEKRFNSGTCDPAQAPADDSGRLCIAVTSEFKGIRRPTKAGVRPFSNP